MIIIINKLLTHSNFKIIILKILDQKSTVSQEHRRFILDDENSLRTRQGRAGATPGSHAERTRYFEGFKNRVGIQYIIQYDIRYDVSGVFLARRRYVLVGVVSLIQRASVALAWMIMHKADGYPCSCGVALAFFSFARRCIGS